MYKIYKGFVIQKIQFKLIKVLYSYLFFNKKYNIKFIKYKKYLIEDSRDEAFKGDLILFKNIYPKSKLKYYKLIKVIKKNDTKRIYI
uniref:30S ribosomal protein S17 n=1 Tax=Nephromyces sp. ex Molgula occidentalis TaxID=2544991 RepID=A0A5C1H838_9APIC|nr:30S ribosomal protein S17 [Nephromyces sp. ex Molgula occidentalis]